MKEVTLKCAECKDVVLWEHNTCKHPVIVKRVGSPLTLRVDPTKTVPDWCPRKADEQIKEMKDEQSINRER